VIGVLAPINEHLAGSEMFRHVGDDQLAVIVSEAFGDRFGERLRDLIGDRSIERHT
jgi:hypothetical protein